MPEHNPGQMGGTMRLGKRRTIFKSNTSVLSMYPEITGRLCSLFRLCVFLMTDTSFLQENCMEIWNMLRRGTDTDLR